MIPRATRNAIAGSREGALVVRVTAAPVGGAANEALVDLLSRALDAARGEIRIERGGASRAKVVSAPAHTLGALRRWARE